MRFFPQRWDLGGSASETVAATDEGGEVHAGLAGHFAREVHSWERRRRHCRAKMRIPRIVRPHEHQLLAGHTTKLTKTGSTGAARII